MNINYSHRQFKLIGVTCSDTEVNIQQTLHMHVVIYQATSERSHPLFVIGLLLAVIWLPANFSVAKNHNLNILHLSLYHHLDAGLKYKNYLTLLIMCRVCPLNGPWSYIMFWCLQPSVHVSFRHYVLSVWLHAIALFAVT